jgi:hypothetical protein
MMAAPWVLLKVPNAREHHSEGHTLTFDKWEQLPGVINKVSCPCLNFMSAHISYRF